MPLTVPLLLPLPTELIAYYLALALVRTELIYRFPVTPLCSQVGVGVGVRVKK